MELRIYIGNTRKKKRKVREGQMEKDLFERQKQLEPSSKSWKTVVQGK